MNFLEAEDSTQINTHIFQIYKYVWYGLDLRVFDLTMSSYVLKITILLSLGTVSGIYWLLMVTEWLVRSHGGCSSPRSAHILFYIGRAVGCVFVLVCVLSYRSEVCSICLK
jgi:hypothetical protein